MADYGASGLSSRQRDARRAPARLPVADKACLYELPVREVLLTHNTREIRVRLHGGAVTGLDNFRAGLTFFDSHVCKEHSNGKA